VQPCDWISTGIRPYSRHHTDPLGHCVLTIVKTYQGHISVYDTHCTLNVRQWHVVFEYPRWLDRGRVANWATVTYFPGNRKHFQAVAMFWNTLFQQYLGSIMREMCTVRQQHSDEKVRFGGQRIGDTDRLVTFCVGVITRSSRAWLN